MARSFPIDFKLDRFKGPRAGQPRNPADAFQHLVSHAFKDVFGNSATGFKSEGIDGGIDVFVDHPAEGIREFLGIEAPAIIECKHHDSSLAAWEKNMLREWERVAAKLRIAFADGRADGAYSPWHRARSYVYCVSATIPNQATRDTLTACIQSFFSALPGPNPKIHHVRVLSWSDLRAWFDTLPRVADAWLGIGLERVFEHQQFVAGLAGFRSFLLSDRHPYLPPDHNSDSHPERLFHRLRANREGGILIVGAGGVGKTRTLIEVANVALSHQWRVLHARRGMGAEDLADAVAQAGGPVLLMLDYLDSMTEFDADSYREVAMMAATRKAQLRVFATARPGFVMKGSPWADLLHQIDLNPLPADRAAVARSLVRSVALQATQVLGTERIYQVCGSNPIIALLIAKQLEDRAASGQLAADEGPQLISGGELTIWLKARLEYDNLKVENEQRSGSFREQYSVQRHLIAVAAMLAYAPLPFDEWIQVGTHALRLITTGGTGNLSTLEREAQYIFEELVQLGWVEARRNAVAVVHDVVSDVVLTDVLFGSGRRMGGALKAVFPHAKMKEAMLREDVLKTVLSVGESNVTILPALLQNIGRLRTSITDDVANESLTHALGAWLEDRAETLGPGLAGTTPDVAYAVLASFISDLNWRRSVAVCWNELVQPVLSTFPETPYARAFLREALSLSTEMPISILPTVLSWVESNRGRQKALDVVVRMLICAPEGTRADVENAALAFVEHHLTTKPTVSRIALCHLLRQPQLTRPNQVAAVALVWLRQYGRELEAQFVLNALLKMKPGLLDVELNELIVSWLRTFSRHESAGWLLRTLLDQYAGTQLPQRLEEPVAVWLAYTSGRYNAGHVFMLLINIPLRRPARIISSLLTWLARFGGSGRAEIFLPLLTNAVAANENAVGAANAWLKKRGNTVQAGVVLAALVSAKKDSAETIEASVRWLEQYPKHPVAGVLFEVVYRDALNTPLQGTIHKQAIAWATAHVGDLQTGQLIGLALQSGGSEDCEQWLETAAAYVQRHAKNTNVQSVLVMLLERVIPDERLIRRVVYAAIRWMRGERPNEARSAILGALLKRVDLEPKKREKVVSRAFQFLEEHMRAPFGHPILEGLLRRRDLSKLQRIRAAELTQAWLAANESSAHHASLAAEYRAFLSAVVQNAHPFPPGTQLAPRLVFPP